MSERYIFHLALPVTNLQTSKQFYVDTLGASIGREGGGWLDILLWGHQITLQLSPEDVLSRERQGMRHFGVVLPWSAWESLAAQLQAKGTSFFRSPAILQPDTPQEQAKLYLEDPSNHVIEIKAYRNLSLMMGREQCHYDPQSL